MLQVCNLQEKEKKRRKRKYQRKRIKEKKKNISIIYSIKDFNRKEFFCQDHPTKDGRLLFKRCMSPLCGGDV